MIWADREGNIGWQSVGIAPVRRHWSGLVPVPGDGSYEWDGYLPIKAKPNVYNPKSGIFYTANANVTPNDYPYFDAVGFSWSDPFRQNRVAELLNNGRRHSLMDMAQYQTDYLSIPARQLVPLLKHLPVKDQRTEIARQFLLDWDYKLEPNSISAGIYHAWERQLMNRMEKLVVPEKAQPYASVQLKKVIDWLVLPDSRFGPKPIAGRDAFLLVCLQEAVNDLSNKLGEDIYKRQYGQRDYKHIVLRHPLSNAVKPDIRAKLEVGPAPRGGNGHTVNSTGGNDNQSSGASFRLIVDTGDWDACLGTNTPGQSGDPDHPHYRDLFDIWAKDQFFPVFYSREKVEAVKDEVIQLIPGK